MYLDQPFRPVSLSVSISPSISYSGISNVFIFIVVQFSSVSFYKYELTEKKSSYGEKN